MQTSSRPAAATRAVETAPVPTAGRGVRAVRWTLRSVPGAWGALALIVLSATPSLLPRGGVLQGTVTGISAAIGYGLGVMAAFVWRAFADREARVPRSWAWQALGVGVVVVWAGALVAGWVWQRQLAALMGAPRGALWNVPVSVLVAVAVFVLILVVGRGLRGAYRALAALLSRRIGARAARVVGWLVVVVGGLLVVSGVLVDGFVAAANQTFSLRDSSTDEGVIQPTSPLRSGSPDSLAPWESLGRQGRNFVASGPSASEIAAFSGAEGAEPVRIYSGIDTATDVEDRARIAVADLERAGGFNRQHLVVATTTGTGWLDPGSIASFEYLTGGDSAIVTMQYSFLPSWISYLVDQVPARHAGRELFDAVYEHWVRLPAEERPRLYVFGESLGSFGAEAAFSGEFDLRNRTDGAIFVGPPAFNPLHREFTDGREPGTRQVEPVFRDGRTVRFSNEIAAGAPPQDTAWDGPRILYLQHPSDPIVWWGTDLLRSRPDWLREQRGRDVLDSMVWIPFVTFWQVSADLPFAIDVPDGHGHRYTAEAADAWATVLDVPDWSPERAQQLRVLIQP